MLLAEEHEAPGLANPARELLEAIKTTLDPNHSGGVRDILRGIETVLGTE